MDDLNIKVGDVVVVINLFNPPQMLVTNIRRHENDSTRWIITCVWFAHDEKIQKHDFPSTVLKNLSR